jgi:hypothetical protein
VINKPDPQLLTISHRRVQRLSSDDPAYFCFSQLMRVLAARVPTPAAPASEETNEPAV